MLTCLLDNTQLSLYITVLRKDQFHLQILDGLVLLEPLLDMECMLELVKNKETYLTLTLLDLENHGHLL